MAVERAIPRHPGPKEEWSEYLETSTVGLTVVFGSPASNANYWIDTLDVTQLASGTQNELFYMVMQNTVIPTDPQRVFFGGQVSANTGLYFPYRGKLRIIPGTSILLNNLNGTWAVNLGGFLTSSDNAT
jgi:hypothetical protein